MRRASLVAFFFSLVLLSGSSVVRGQLANPFDPQQLDGVNTKPTPSPTPTATPWPAPEHHFIQHIFRDQYTIWTAPFRPKNYSREWIVPIGLGAATLIATDRFSSAWVDDDGALPKISKDISYIGTYPTIGTAAAFYLGGRFAHNAKARETGVLAIESMINAGIVTRVLKEVSRRQRPNTDEHSGEFFDGGSSFPSGHASNTWSVATVIAYEYWSNPWIRYGAFGVATAVSLARYSGRNHFLSDVTIGSALGFGIGRYVFREYHNPNVEIGKPTKTTWLHPEITPYVNTRSREFGGQLAWSF